MVVLWGLYTGVGVVTRVVGIDAAVAVVVVAAVAIVVVAVVNCCFF